MTMMTEEEKKQRLKEAKALGYDGFISEIHLASGKKYLLRAYVTEVHPITCKKCGGQLELKYGEGKCTFCGTHYSTQFNVVETGGG